MAGGTWKKVTFVSLLLTVLAWVLFALLKIYHKKHPENSTANTGSKVSLALGIICLVLTIVAGVMWAKRRSGGAAKPAGDMDSLSDLSI